MTVPARTEAETRTTVHHRRRSASAALMPLPEAVTRLSGLLAPVAARDIPLAEAVGRVAAQDVVATRDCPARPVALRDGWAARADDVLGASPYAPIPLMRPLAWVESGGAMPEGTDVVLPFEAVEGRTVVADATAREGTRAGGEEIGRAACLIPAGARITPRHRLALRAAGVDALPVRMPRLRLVVMAGTEPESLSACLAAMAEAEGAMPEVVAVPRRPDTLAAALDAPGADAVFLVGGTGYGQGDHGAEALERAGRLLAHGIALRPGETAGFGEVRGRPVLMLPGRPDAALAVFLALGRPLIAAGTGGRAPVPARAPLLAKIVSTIGVSEIVFARRERDGIQPLGGADLPLRSLIAADVAILVAAESEGHPAGTCLDVLPL